MNKKFKYECDGGTIMIGNATSRACFPNGYGDGRFTVEVSTEKTYPSNMHWLGTVEGDNLHIYDYDCLHGEDVMDNEHILFTLPTGRWAVYVKDGYVRLEQWN